jgi:hypothetical protein
MTIEEIIEKFGEPEIAWNNSLGRTATENSYYLYELHEMHDFWENHVWIFNNLQEFYDFAYSMVMVDYMYKEERDNRDTIDQIELYKYLTKLKNIKWTIEECQNFIKTFHHASFELVQFGKVIDLINLTTEDFEKCKEVFHTKEELKTANIEEGIYKIVSAYIDQYDKRPLESIEDFLTFLSNW